MIQLLLPPEREKYQDFISNNNIMNIQIYVGFVAKFF